MQTIYRVLRDNNLCVFLLIKFCFFYFRAEKEKERQKLEQLLQQQQQQKQPKQPLPIQQEKPIDPAIQAELDAQKEREKVIL